MNALLLKRALRYYGIKEIAGRKAQPQIVEWLRAVIPGVKSDEVAWCSAFMHAIAREAGAQAPEQRKGLAREWLKVGDEIDPAKACAGDVVIFKRGNKSWQGHVALFISRQGNTIYALGGNQGNAVKISSYPASRLIGVRRLRAQGALTCGE